VHAAHCCGENWDEEEYPGQVRDVGVSRKENSIEDCSWDIQKNCEEVEVPEVGSLGATAKDRVIGKG